MFGKKKKTMDLNDVHQMPVAIRSVTVAGVGTLTLGQKTEEGVAVDNIHAIPGSRAWLGTDEKNHPIMCLDGTNAPNSVTYVVPVSTADAFKKAKADAEAKATSKVAAIAKGAVAKKKKKVSK